ncbi:MAG: hypothetical protein JNL01_01850 [Bdellovibrionales bacterium]|nr:hypothetical protein [Bdellovibrionales bacterium]
MNFKSAMGMGFALLVSTSLYAQAGHKCADFMKKDCDHISGCRWDARDQACVAEQTDAEYLRRSSVKRPPQSKIKKKPAAGAKPKPRPIPVNL